MHPLLDRYLTKLGITKPTELSREELTTFERWKGVLGKDALTVDDFAAFCRNQIAVIEQKWRDSDAPKDRNERLIAQFNVYRLILEVIASPKLERGRLERQLEDMIRKI